jgi:hypothetical protein
MGFWRGVGLGASSPGPDAIILREPDKPGFEEDIAQIITSAIGGFHADVIGQTSTNGSLSRVNAALGQVWRAEPS